MKEEEGRRRNTKEEERRTHFSDECALQKENIVKRKLLRMDKFKNIKNVKVKARFLYL